ncbi:MAG: response regulator [Acidobacteriota bacterium]
MQSASEKRTRRKLLLVEDDRDLRDALCQLLSDTGYDVVCAENGREALEYLAKSPAPCLVLLDLMMPVMNGWEFRAEQRKNEKISGIPVVVVTADGRADLKALALGVDDYLRKPIEIERLLDIVSRYGC